MFMTGFVVGLLLIAVALCLRGYFIVHEGEAAILTSFGRPVGGDAPREYGPGLHFKAV